MGTAVAHWNMALGVSFGRVWLQCDPNCAFGVQTWGWEVG